MAKKTTSKSSKTSSKPTAKPEQKAQPKKAAAGNGKSAPKTKKAPPEKQAVEPAPTTSAEPKTAAKATKAPRARDPRLPAPGTVLQKKDRHGNVRCECTVEEDGIHYKGTVYRSLSAAAMAASKDLGLGGSANGFLFFGLIKQPARAGDPTAALERAWARYRERAKGIMASDLEANTRQRVQEMLVKHSQEIAAIG